MLPVIVDQCGILWKRQMIKIPSNWVISRAGELVYPWGRTAKVYCWPCQLKRDYFLWPLWIDILKKVFAKSIPAHQASGNVLIYLIKTIMSEIAAAVKNYYLIKFLLATVILHDPSVCLLHRPNREMWWELLTVCFKSLMVMLVSGTYSRMWY